MGLRIINGVPYFDGQNGGFPEGTRVCSYCLLRPARVDRSRVQSYCRVCATEANRRSRKGKFNMLLSPEERLLIRELRQVEPAGRHHAGLSVMNRDGLWRRMLVPCAMNVALCSIALWAPFLAARGAG